MDKLTKIGVDPYKMLAGIGQDIVAEIFALLVGENTAATLNAKAFTLAVKLMWTKLLLAADDRT